MAGPADAPVLGRRALNRALLARQMLLDRARVDALEAVERLVGLHAQMPAAPYFALCARLDDFAPETLAALLRARRVVRLALMRSTLYLVSGRDCLGLRAWLAPMIERRMPGRFRVDLAGVDPDALARSVRALLDAAPRTPSELGAALGELWVGHDPDALAAGARAFVPLVQVPPRGLWRQGGAARHVAAEHWLGAPLGPAPPPEETLRRYLAACGPATLRDMQAWSGASGLGAALARLRPHLRVFRSERGQELLDLPEAPRPDPQTPAPPRFVGEFDGVLVSHADRRRVLDDAHRGEVLTTNGLVRAVLLLDGFVAATWRLRRQGATVALAVEPLRRLSRVERLAAEAEGLALLARCGDERGAVVFADAR